MSCDVVGSVCLSVYPNMVKKTKSSLLENQIIIYNDLAAYFCSLHSVKRLHTVLSFHFLSTLDKGSPLPGWLPVPGLAAVLICY